MSYAVPVVTSFGEAYGEQLRTLREAAGATQEQLSRELARLGITWTRARVSQVEAGRGVPDLDSMIAVALALGRLGPEPVRLADLLPANSPNREISRLRDALLGAPLREFAPEIGAVANPRHDPSYGVVEDLVAKQVGDLPEVILRVARELYGHSGTEERALRAGPDPTPQKLGAMGRGVVKELVDAVNADISEGDY